MDTLSHKRIFGTLKHDRKFILKLLGSGLFTALGVYELGLNLELAFVALVFVPLAGLFFTFLKLEADSKILRHASIAVAAAMLGYLTGSYFLTAAFFLMLEGATHQESIVRLPEFRWIKAVRTESCMDELYRLASRHVLFHTLPKKEREGLAEVCHVARLGAGDPLIRQGEFNEYLFMIGKGKAEVVADGERRATLGRGDIVGEISASGLSLPVADVVATTELTAFAFPVDVINELAGKHRRFAETMREIGMRRIEGETPRQAAEATRDTLDHPRQSERSRARG